MLSLSRDMLTVAPRHGAQVRFWLGTDLNTPFFQVTTPEFGLSACAWVQSNWALNGTWVLRVPRG